MVLLWLYLVGGRLAQTASISSLSIQQAAFPQPKVPHFHLLHHRPNLRSLLPRHHSDHNLLDHAGRMWSADLLHRLITQNRPTPTFRVGSIVLEYVSRLLLDCSDRAFSNVLVPSQVPPIVSQMSDDITSLLDFATYFDNEAFIL